jgi:uncharacterized DUF497 family protein
MRFEWDPEKNRTNQAKHGVSFVVYTERQEDIIRIMSARKATKEGQERLEKYWRGWHE